MRDVVTPRERGDDASPAGRARVPRTRVVLITCAVVLGLAVAAGAWVGIRGVMAKAELEALLPLEQPLRDAAQARDLESLGDLTAELETHASAAAGLTGDPVWRLAEFLPVVGANMGAVRVVSAEAAAMASAAQPLIEILRGGSEGGDPSALVDLLVDARAPLEEAAAAFTHADAELGGIRSDDLIDQLARAVTSMASFAEETAPAVQTVAQAAVVLPGVLGADGPRTLLVSLQNNAELRTGGGITGSFVLLEASEGHLALVDQTDPGQFPARSTPIAAIPESTLTLYGDNVGTFVQNASITPDFDLSAELLLSWWAEYSDVVPDAVISIDVPVIAALLGVSGPATLPDGSELSADNLVERVLVEPYFTLQPDEQSVFQRVVTTIALGRVLSAGVDPFAWMEALAAPVAEGRISMWSATPAEQEVLSASPLAGPAERLSRASDTAFAVYLNDATAGKMDSFLDVGFAVGSKLCRTDDREDLAVAIVMTNTAPADAGTTWPWFMTGGGLAGITPGEIATDITVAAPPGSFYGGVWVDGELIGGDAIEDAGFPSARTRITLAPGQTSTIEFRFLAADSGPQSTSLIHTPMIRPAPVADYDLVCG